MAVTFHASRKEALCALDSTSGCVEWMEKGVRMAAIWFNGERHIHPADYVYDRSKKRFIPPMVKKK